MIETRSSPKRVQGNLFPSREINFPGINNSTNCKITSNAIGVLVKWEVMFKLASKSRQRKCIVFQECSNKQCQSMHFPLLTAPATVSFSQLTVVSSVEDTVLKPFFSLYNGQDVHNNVSGGLHQTTPTLVWLRQAPTVDELDLGGKGDPFPNNGPMFHPRNAFSMRQQ